jgi:hypothetical protein
LAAERDIHRVVHVPDVYPLPRHSHRHWDHRGWDRGVKVRPGGVGVSWGKGRFFIRF